MAYFTKFPKIKYNFNGVEKDITDIFRRVAFDKKSLNDKKIFSEYYVISGETIDSIALNVYGSSDFYWLILLANNIISPLEEPQGEDLILQKIETVYTGKAIYCKSLLSNVAPGDVVVKVSISGSYRGKNTKVTTVDSNNYGIIKSYDPNTRALWVDNITGSFSSGDFISFYRKNEDGTNSIITFDTIVGVPGPTFELERDFSLIEKIIDYKKSLVEFKDSNLNYMSPYYFGITQEIASNAIGEYSNLVTIYDPNTIDGTSLQKFMDDESGDFSTYTTLDRKIIEDNSKFRIIKILNRPYLSYVYNKISELISSNETKKIVINFEE